MHMYIKPVNSLNSITVNRMPPDKGLADKMLSGVKGKKVRITYAFTANADGSEKRRPFIIGRAHKPRAFENKTGEQLGFYYRNNAKAWMTSSLYQEWIREWDCELQQKKRKILLLQDNFSGHIIPDGIENIRVENFAPNLTAHVQPMDQGIIRCFKAHYRSKFIQRAIENYDKGDSPAKIYEINQLEAMRLADIAWKEVDTTTIRNCWRKADILPAFDSPSEAQPTIPISSLLDNTVSPVAESPISGAEKDIEEALEGLATRGMLQKGNRMCIDALLNPADESQVIDETTEEDICQAVLEARKEREQACNDDAPANPRPTYQEVLRAASTIKHYIDSIDDPIARKLEVTLASFTRQTCLEQARTLTTTKITDYFTPKAF